METTRHIEQSQLQAIFDTAVDGIILIDAHGIISTFNPACEKLFGYSAGEVIGKNVKIIMPEPYRAEHDGYIHNYLRTGERKIIGIGREVVGRRKDGSTFPMRLSVGEARQNGTISFVGIIHDLTERQRTDRALRDSIGRLRALVDTAVDGVILIDSRASILMFNRACELLFGYTVDEVIGENVRILMPEPYHSEHDQYIANYLATGERKIIGIGRDVTGRAKGGRTFPMYLAVGEAEQDGERVFFGIIRDLTEQKRTEQQLIQAQKMEAVGQLSGGIAHDFNNLLTVIIGNADDLGERLKARPDLQALAEGIAGAGQRGAELTRRLLAFSRRQTLHPVELDPNELIQSMRSLLNRTLHGDIEIVLRLDPELWRTYADPSQLESAILNLAINSQDAMPRGGTLTISTANVPLDHHYRDLHPEVQPGAYVMIAVTDDGEGMNPDVLAHVFEPFFTTKEVGKGTGLGLSMVYGFVKQSNGHVGVYSEPGLGTTVRIYLPARSGEAKDAVPAERSFAEVVVKGEGETVLVVEDDKFVRSYAVGTIQSLGYNVLVASNGHEALAKLANERVDLLFTDIVMPGGIHGWELAARAREMKPNLKVVVTSGYALETLASRGLIREDISFLNKPFHKAELSQRLREALDAQGGAGSS